jgi:membrane protein DedA with SNARE-associated domain
METSTFTALVSWVVVHGYFLFFIAAFLEGPLVTAAAGVAAALGYYNLYIIIAISVLGDLAADVVYYSIGYWGGRPFLNRFGHRIGMHPERIAKLEKLLRTHMRKTLVVVKLSPILPIPGLITIGSVRTSIRKFVETSLIITLPKSVLFALIGFYSGRAYAELNKTIVHSQYVIFAVLLVVVLAYIVYRMLSKYVSDKIEKI